MQPHQIRQALVQAYAVDSDSPPNKENLWVPYDIDADPDDPHDEENHPLADDAGFSDRDIIENISSDRARLLYETSQKQQQNETTSMQQDIQYDRDSERILNHFAVIIILVMRKTM